MNKKIEKKTKYVKEVLEVYLSFLHLTSFIKKYKFGIATTTPKIIYPNVAT